jgi:hypothetical protein
MIRISGCHKFSEKIFIESVEAVAGRDDYDEAGFK